jgi:hypothetical protein
MSTTDPKTPVLLTAGGVITEYWPANGTDFTLQELQEAVGGMIEVIRMPDPGSLSPARIMVMNEEGRLHGLAQNVLASGAFGVEGHIVGNVVVCPSKMLK